MKKISSLGIAALLLILFSVNSCKKEKTIEVYFTTLEDNSVMGNAPTTVTIEFSDPTTAIVELQLKSIGTDPIYFGTYNESFLHDDSLKCRATVGPTAYIDSSGYMRIGYGVKTVVITLTPQVDNFPHAAAEYKMQISDAKNAVIRTGSDVFTFSLDPNSATPLLSSSILYNGLEHDSWHYADTIIRDTMLQKQGVFTLVSYHAQRTTLLNAPLYDILLTYGYVSGDCKTTTISIYYPFFPKPQLGENIFACANGQMSISWNAPSAFGVQSSTSVGIDCSVLTSDTTKINVTQFSDPIYGPYSKFTGTIDLKQDSTYSFKGNFDSEFMLFD